MSPPVHHPERTRSRSVDPEHHDPSHVLIRQKSSKNVRLETRPVQTREHNAKSTKSAKSSFIAILSKLPPFIH